MAATFIRLLVDLILLGLFILVQANIYTGNRFHEWNGIAMLLLLAFHIVLNRRWFLTLFQGRYLFRRWFSFFINLALAGLFIALVGCAFFISRTVFTFDSIEGSKGLLLVHATLSCWLLVVAGLHVGLFWNRIKGWLGLLLPGMPWGKYPKISFSVQLFIVSCGIYASFTREMAAKLFLLPSENYYLPNQTMVSFCFLNLSIMALYTVLTHWFMRLCTQRSRQV